MIDKTLVVPIYNEIGAIDDMLDRVSNFIIDFDDWDVVIVDDGSTDGTNEKILDRDFSNRIRILHHEENKGYGAALKTGILSTESSLIGIIDADGTYPFDEFKNLLEYCDKYHMVVGARVKKGVAIPFIKKLPKFFIRKFANYITDTDVVDFNSGMRIFKRDLSLKLMNYLPDGFSFTTTITVASSSNKIPVKYVPISYMDRVGKSKIKPIRDTINFFLLIFKLGIYYKPFKVYGPLVITSGGLGVFLMIYRMFYGEGFLVVTIVSFLLSIIFMCFAMIAHSISMLFRDNLNS
jgi:glycosyltransferase involved in cell wall biosynthesis